MLSEFWHKGFSVWIFKVVPFICIASFRIRIGSYWCALYYVCTTRRAKQWYYCVPSFQAVSFLDLAILFIANQDRTIWLSAGLLALELSERKCVCEEATNRWTPYRKDTARYSWSRSRVMQKRDSELYKNNGHVPEVLWWSFAGCAFLIKYGALLESLYFDLSKCRFGEVLI